jgi:hypothetical protein
MKPPARETLVESLVRQSGLHIINRDADRYWLRFLDGSPARIVHVKHGENMCTMGFTAELAIRFPLDKEVQGLFARLMMRSTELCYASWRMDIGGSTQAIVYLYAQAQVLGLSDVRFQAIIREMTAELLAVEAELRAKFSWGRNAGSVQTPPPQQAAAGVPACRTPDSRGITFLDEWKQIVRRNDDD